MVDIYDLIIISGQLRRLLEEDQFSIEAAIQGELADEYRKLMDLELQEAGRIEKTIRYSIGISL